MKKVIILLAVAALCAAVILPAYAAEVFVPSISYKGEPEIVPTEVTTPEDPNPQVVIGVVRDQAKAPSDPTEPAAPTQPAQRDDFVSYIHESCLVVTPIAQAENAKEIPEEAVQELLHVYKELSSGNMKLPYEKVEGIKAEDMVIMELLDASWLCGTPERDNHPTQVEPDGIVFDITFDLGVAVDAKVVVMTYHDGQWDPIVDVKNNRDGTVTCTFEHLCPVAIAVENGEPVEGPAQTGDTADITLWIAIMLAALAAIIALLLAYKKKARK